MKTDTRLLTATPADLAAAADALKRGDVVAIPTETVYGLAADALNEDAVRRIFEAKGRPADNPLIVHIADRADWAKLVTEIPPAAAALADAFWPGPLTIILPRSPLVPNVTTGDLDTVAVRFPSHPIAQEIIRRSGCVLAAPSANRSGSPSPTSAAHVMADLDGKIAAVVDGGRCDVGVESTVITLAGDTPRLLRPGGITPAMISAVIGEIEIDPAVTAALTEGQVAASPGMKYKHYAPTAHVTLVTGDADAYRRFVNRRAAPTDTALCLEEDVPFLPIATVTYGTRRDPATQAQGLFDALRELDARGATRVLAASPDPDGIGLAVYNRLLRAAGFEVMSGDDECSAGGADGTDGRG